MRAHFEGRGPAPTELIELTYRERFHLSSAQMEEEPAAAVGYWLAVEDLRSKQEKRRRH